MPGAARPCPLSIKSRGMHADPEDDIEWARRDRLLPRLGPMVESGRLTPEEAERLRGATDSSEFNGAVREIRVRHAGMQLDAAVADGRTTRVEADGFLDRLRRGEHGRFLRSRLHGGGRAPRE
jgi:hypothetical protein